MVKFFVCIPRGRAEIVILVGASVETETSANARRNVRSRGWSSGFGLDFGFCFGTD